MRLDLSRKSECFVNTMINAECFNPHGHTDDVNSVTYSMDGRRISCGSWDKTIRIWDEKTYRQIGGPMANKNEVSPDGRKIASRLDDGTFRICDATTHEYIDTIEPLFGIDLFGLDFSLADFDERSKKILYQNGVVVSNATEKDIA